MKELHKRSNLCKFDPYFRKPNSPTICTPPQFLAIHNSHWDLVCPLGYLYKYCWWHNFNVGRILVFSRSGNGFSKAGKRWCLVLYHLWWKRYWLMNDFERRVEVIRFELAFSILNPYRERGWTSHIIPRCRWKYCVSSWQDIAGMSMISSGLSQVLSHSCNCLRG